MAVISKELWLLVFKLSITENLKVVSDGEPSEKNLTSALDTVIQWDDSDFMIWLINIHKSLKNKKFIKKIQDIRICYMQSLGSTKSLSNQ